jgi:DNA-binding GntR family transcriptional regulator
MSSMTKAPARPPAPAYKVVANDLREAILQNRYPEGHRLPTEEELAAEYGLGRQTIRRVFQELVAEGLIYRVRKRGTFAYPVTTPLTSSFGHIADIMDYSAEDETEIVTPLHEVTPDANVDELLQLGGERASALTIRRVQRTRPLYFAHLRFPPVVTEFLAKEPVLTESGRRGRFTIIGLIDREWPDTIVSLTQTVYAVSAPADVARGLECKPGVSVIKVERLYYDRYGAPVELATTFYHPTNYVMRQRLRR